MKVQYVSDIHLEMRAPSGDFTIDKVGDILLLSGDIGYPSHDNYNFFLQQQSLKFDKVYVITGNHEYYDKTFGGNMTECDNYCREICRKMPRHNVMFLQNEWDAIIPGVNIFGGTFWTRIPEAKAQMIESSINDYVQIKGFTPTTSTSLYERSIEKLEECLRESDEQTQWVVMSHHIPKISLIDKRYRHMGAINYAFAGDIKASDNERVIAHVYGHTHIQNQEGKYFCNPVGYPGENHNFNTGLYFEI